MLSIGTSGPAYSLPYLLNRDAGGVMPKDVLVIGAGSGNDVSAALSFGVNHVDAVEIDPAIAELGLAHHPARPYRSPKVTIHIDDGRSYLHNTEKKYDLIIYALVDSLSLHSGYSSLRLESFLFTEQALRDIKARLKPGGMLAMYNFYRQGWVVGRLQQMVNKVFGAKPLVFSLPHKERITSEDPLGLSVTLVLAGDPETSPLPAIEKALKQRTAFWIYYEPKTNIHLNGYGPKPPDLPADMVSAWLKISPAEIDTTGIGPTPTDDWPFLYLRSPDIPNFPDLHGMALVAGLSLGLLWLFTPRGAGRPSGRMFFLGAGFMLLETKSVVHMALLFGSTWKVNSIVFSAILLMALASNLYVMAVRPKRLWPYYALLAAALLINIAVPMSTFLALPGQARIVISCLVAFLPIAFAGVIFATTFRDSQHPDRDFGSNVGGAILGGLTENVSSVLGFNLLLVVALGFYALSAALRPRR